MFPAPARIGIVHFGFDGHTMPAIRIGCALASRGHEVIAWAPERYRARVEAADTRLMPFDPFELRPIASFEDFPAATAEGTALTMERLATELDEAALDLLVHDTQ